MPCPTDRSNYRCKSLKKCVVSSVAFQLDCEVGKEKPYSHSAMQLRYMPDSQLEIGLIRAGWPAQSTRYSNPKQYARNASIVVELLMAIIKIDSNNANVSFALRLSCWPSVADKTVSWNVARRALSDKSYRHPPANNPHEVPDKAFE